MFVSQLYTGSILDKQIGRRSGFLEFMSRKKEVQKLKMVIVSWQTRALILKKA